MQLVRGLETRDQEGLLICGPRAVYEPDRGRLDFHTFGVEEGRVSGVIILISPTAILYGFQMNIEAVVTIYFFTYNTHLYSKETMQYHQIPINTYEHTLIYALRVIHQVYVVCKN